MRTAKPAHWVYKLVLKTCTTKNQNMAWIQSFLNYFSSFSIIGFTLQQKTRLLPRIFSNATFFLSSRPLWPDLSLIQCHPVICNAWWSWRSTGSISSSRAIMDMRLACKCPGDDGRGSETTQFSRHRLPASS